MVLLSFGMLAAFAGIAEAQEKPASQVIVEVGTSVPFGNLGGDFDKTRLGLGATKGLEIGFSYRIPLTQTVSIAPTFLFLDYGDYKGEDDSVGEYRIQSSSYRFGAELMVMKPGSFNSVRPFLGVGAGLFRNRITGFIDDFYKAIDKSVNTLGVTMRVGVQIIGLELSVVYNVNRFNTWQFHQSDYRERYNWDSISFRAGWLIPFGS